MFHRSIRVRQHDVTDCGAACLASVAAHYHLLLPIARIRQLASTDQRGTNVLGLLEAAQKLGFQAKGVKGPLESLAKIPKPAIAHVVTAKGLHHYVVLYRVTKTHVVVMDPGDGRMHKKSHEMFRAEWTGVLVLLLPDEGFQSEDRRVSTLARFGALLRPHRAVVAQIVVGSLAYTLLGLSTSVYIQKITDHVLVTGNLNLLNLLSVAMILLLLLQTALGAVRSLFALKTGQRIDARLILGYYKHLLTLPQSFFDTMRVGEILSRVNDAVKIRVFLNDVASGLIVNAFVVLAAFGLMFTYYWKLALLMLGVLPVNVALYWVSNHINRRQQRRLMEDSADLEAQLVESLNAASTIKRFGLEDVANLKTETRFVRLLSTIYTASRSVLLVGNASELATRLFTILVLWAGAYFVVARELTPGELLSFYALVSYFTGPIAGLIGANRSIQEALIAADRLFEVMDLEREADENRLTLTPNQVGDIRFENVTFKYGSRAMIFDNLTLTIRKGSLTAVVGESGSGKSTLLALLQNLYPLTTGRIRLGDYNLAHVTNDSLRQIVGVVPQRVDLFAGTVVENIAPGDFQPDMARILQICGGLGMTEFIETLPAGFATQLGENGATLSGGQRQRLAIARALYRNPEILVLDEATSALDSISERFVQQTLQTLRLQGKTIVLIAHRLSTVRRADKIMVLSAGQVVEEGTHEELLGEQKRYSELWIEQVAC